YAPRIVKIINSLLIDIHFVFLHPRRMSQDLTLSYPYGIGSCTCFINQLARACRFLVLDSRHRSSFIPGDRPLSWLIGRLRKRKNGEEVSELHSEHSSHLKSPPPGRLLSGRLAL